MSRYKLTVLALVLCLLTPILGWAGPPIYFTSVSVTSTNSVVTIDLDATSDKAYSIVFINDGSKTAYYNLSGVATTAHAPIKAGEHHSIPTDGAFPVTTLGLITNGSDTTTVRVYAFPMKTPSQLDAAGGTGSGTGDALKGDPLSQFAATTSAELAGVITNETGTGVLVFNTSPTFITPLLGTPTSGIATNLTGTAAGLTAGLATNTVTKSGNTSTYVTTTGTQTSGDCVKIDASGNHVANGAACGTGGTTPPATTTYIATTGNDSNDCSVGSKCLTLAHAVGLLTGTVLDTTYTINVADGTYAEAPTIDELVTTDKGLLSIIGNTTTPANVVFTGSVTRKGQTNASDFPGGSANWVDQVNGGYVAGPVNVEFHGVTFTNSAAARNGLIVENKAFVVLDKVTVSSNSKNSLVLNHYARVRMDNNNTFTNFTSNGVLYYWHSLITMGTTAATTTITGPGGSSATVCVYGSDHSLWLVENGNGTTLNITLCKTGFALGLSAYFQNISAQVSTVNITGTNPLTSGSAAVLVTDLSDYASNQTTVITHYDTGFAVTTMSYVESGTSTFSDVNTHVATSQNSFARLGNQTPVNYTNAAQLDTVQTWTAIQTMPSLVLNTTPLAVSSGGTGTAGTLTGIMRGNASAMTAAELSGDVTTSGSNAVTVAKVNGVAYSASPSTDAVPVVTSANTTTYKVIPDCDDTGGQHINYDNTAHAFSCGTSGGSGTTIPAGATFFSSVADAGPSNTATETSVIGTLGAAGTLTLPINTFSDGTLLEVVAQGYFSLPAVSDSLTIKAYCGSTNIAIATFTPGAGVLTNGSWKMHLGITGRGTGAGGTFMTNGLVELSGAALAPTEAAITNPGGVSTGTAFDFTGTCAFELKAKWGAAQAAETFKGSNVAGYLPGAPQLTAPTVNAPLVCLTASASGTTYTCSLTPALAAYTTGHVYHVYIDVVSTGSATLNINGLGAKTIKKRVNGFQQNIAAGDLPAGRWELFTYDGTNLQVVSALGSGDGLSINGMLQNAMSAIVQPTGGTPTAIVTGTGAHNDVFTCPSTNPTTGVTARCYVEAGMLYSNGAATVNTYWEVKIGGTYYPVTSNVSIAASVASNVAIGYVLEAGEIVSCNTASTASFNCWALVTIGDNTSPLKSVGLTTWINGNNTLYTCPASTVCTITNPQSFGRAGGSGRYQNQTGGSLTVVVNVVPSGGSVQTLNRTLNASASNGLSANLPASTYLATGDFINVNTGSNSSAQFAWVNVLERLQ